MLIKPHYATDWEPMGVFAGCRKRVRVFSCSGEEPKYTYTYKLNAWGDIRLKTVEQTLSRIGTE